jgi:hypothetical protein
VATNTRHLRGGRTGGSSGELVLEATREGGRGLTSRMCTSGLMPCHLTWPMGSLVGVRERQSRQAMTGWA